MTTISTWRHSAVSLEKGGSRLVIDPGVYSDPQALRNASAVLITHDHQDHVDAAAVVDSGAPVWTTGAAAAMLKEAGADGSRLHVVAPGERFSAAGFDVVALGGAHAVIHPDLPDEENLAFFIDGTLLHPGDSLAPAPAGAHVRVLFLPIAAPWLNLESAVDYARAVSPEVVVPIHDGTLSEAGAQLTNWITEQLLPGIDYRRLESGASFDVGAD
ncbi:MBL fold metallo-hydrolase [Microbacterium azadirachtae]|uniref:MBL fold metallo-hydrolase n=1 Tax=Microbacterium azadirachtae TaxID=582680 RepID=UPI003F757013